MRRNVVKPTSEVNHVDRWTYVKAGGGFMFSRYVTDRKVLADLINVEQLRERLDALEKSREA